MLQRADKSTWESTAHSTREYPRLAHDLTTDVLIIGGGITGLTAALHLKRRGHEVVVLEAERIGSGTTGKTTAHLDAVPDQDVSKFISDFGEDAARRVTEGRMQAIATIESWTRELAIDCDFRRVPAYSYPTQSWDAHELEKQVGDLRRIGLEASSVERAPVPPAGSGAVRIDNQARFHPLRYLHALAAAVDGDGCRIFEHTRSKVPTDGQPAVAELEGGGKIKANHIIIATHGGYLGISQLDTRIAPYQSYAILARVKQAIPDALYWDDNEPYYYIRHATSDDPHLLVIGGADHKTGQAEDERAHIARVEAYAAAHFDVEEVRNRWSGEFFEPSDHVPHIGRAPLRKSIYYAAAYSGTGMTYGTLAGLLLADIIEERPNPLAAIFSPTRVKPFAEAKSFVSENLNVAKRFIGDRLEVPVVESLDEIRAGEGRLVSYRGSKLAAYREPGGELHLLSPTCTHAGCYVQWNQAESTWDCPCHGGRYAATGRRIYGPPPRDLARADLCAEKKRANE